METSDNLNNKILEERQVEKFSHFVEKYEENVKQLTKKLKTNKKLVLSNKSENKENVSLYSLTGYT